MMVYNGYRDSGRNEAILQAVKRRVNQLGATVDRISINPGVVIAIKQRGNRSRYIEFIVWSYHIENGKCNLYWGHYCNEFDRAYDVYCDKVKRN